MAVKIHLDHQKFEWNEKWEKLRDHFDPEDNEKFFDYLKENSLKIIEVRDNLYAELMELEGEVTLVCPEDEIYVFEGTLDETYKKIFAPIEVD